MKPTQIKILLCLLLAITASSCRHTPSNIPELSGANTLTEVAKPQREEYNIAVNDLLEISFLAEPEYTQEVRVDWDGEIDLSFLGTVEQTTQITAADKTIAEVIRSINTLARQNGILISPRSHVRVLEYSERTFSILGHIFSPGMHPFPEGKKPVLELEEAIAMAGGYTQLANIHSVYIKRGKQIYRVNLKKLLTEGQDSFQIIPDDIITVLERII